ncbi:MAG: hypothetical protein JWM10_4915 [Myxococcaceae bacterium]|nr:hypothetical protein [Myxococcaceae bacterium]
MSPTPTRTPMTAAEKIARLVTAVTQLRDTVGQVGTDASALDRVEASDFLLSLGLRSGEFPAPQLVAIVDTPAGFTRRRPIVLLGATPTARRFDDATRAALGVHVFTVLEFELPVILPRWAFDQVHAPQLGDMQLSASTVISVQRSLLLVDRRLMVRVGKVISDPRAQMGSMQEPTLLPVDPDSHYVIPPRR